MNQNDMRNFAAAFDICIGKIENGTDRQAAIEETVAVLGSLVSDMEELRNYLYENISFSAYDIASMLRADNRKDREWWNKFRQESGFKGTY